MFDIKDQETNLANVKDVDVGFVDVKDQLVWPKGKKYRYLRRNISALQGGTSGSSAMTMQASEFELLIGSTKFVWPSGTTISTNATSSGDNETIDKLIDGSTNTKRCPSNLSWSWPLYAQIDFGDEIDLSSITNWRWYNGNDTASYPARNPASGSIQVSNNLIDWKTISTFTSSESKSNANYGIAYTGSINWENKRSPTNPLCRYKFDGDYSEATGTFGNATGTATFETLSSGLKVLKTDGNNMISLPEDITATAKTTYTIAFRMKILTTSPTYGYYAGSGSGNSNSEMAFYESTAGRNFFERGGGNFIECTLSGIGMNRRLVVIRSNGTARSNVGMLINGQYSEISRSNSGLDSSSMFGYSTGKAFVIGGRYPSASGTGQKTSIMMSNFVLSDSYRDNTECLKMFNQLKSKFGIS